MDISYIIPGATLVSGGILPFCISFVLLDIATNQYGYIRVKKIIMLVLICKVIMALFLYSMMQIRPATSFHYESSYQIVILMMFRAFWASFWGTLVSFYLNCYIFSKLYVSFYGRMLWLRCLVATTMGEIVFSLVSTPILFWGKLDIHHIFLLIFHNYGFKLIFEFASLPVIYLLVYLLNKYEMAFQISYSGFNPPHKKINAEI
jgi:uncharacterized integral membrane protein (TIGR00697 family)